jgi:ankyrin repeat protein
LLAAGADPDLPDKASGQTPLHYAASNGNSNVLEELLSKWALQHRCWCAGGGVGSSGGNALQISPGQLSIPLGVEGVQHYHAEGLLIAFALAAIQPLV